jgi:hypothetical protein
VAGQKGQEPESGSGRGQRKRGAQERRAQQESRRSGVAIGRPAAGADRGVGTENYRESGRSRKAGAGAGMQAEGDGCPVQIGSSACRLIAEDGPVVRGPARRCCVACRPCGAASGLRRIYAPPRRIYAPPAAFLRHHAPVLCRSRREKVLQSGKGRLLCRSPSGSRSFTGSKRQDDGRGARSKCQGGSVRTMPRPRRLMRSQPIDIPGRDMDVVTQVISLARSALAALLGRDLPPGAAAHLLKMGLATSTPLRTTYFLSAPCPAGIMRPVFGVAANGSGIRCVLLRARGANAVIRGSDAMA